MYTPTSISDTEYKRKRVRCDCAHASIWCGLAQVWLLMAVDVKVRRAGARVQWSCDESLPCHPGVFSTYGPSSDACASMFCRRAQPGLQLGGLILQNDPIQETALQGQTDREYAQAERLSPGIRPSLVLLNP